jgi:3-methylcrotonyl-CoA carboxylase alpha subunit
LDEALSHTRIVGLTTNVQFLRHIIRTDSFATAKLDTALIQREEKALFAQEPLGLALTAASVVANTLQQEQTLKGHDPFSARDGWRAYGVASRHFGFVFHGASHDAELTYAHDGSLHLSVTEAEGDASGLLTYRQDDDALHISFAGQQARVQVFHETQGHEDVAHVFAPQGATRITVVDALAHAGEVQEAGGRLTAPMPGKVVSFAVAAGDKVKAGQALAVMEAMKMEHTIAAPADGEVLELLYAPGDQVAEGEELLKLKL